MTQRHCSLGDKAVLWEPPGQHAAGRKGPWELGMAWGGGRWEGRSPSWRLEWGAGGSTGLFWDAERGTRDTEGGRRTFENKV